MPTYIGLMRWTQKGIENVKDSPARLDAAKAAFQAAGAEIKEFYMVMGQYDMVVVTEAESEDAAVKATLAVAANGSVRSETLRAYTEDEYRRLIGELP
jgi:uncharacterized protein with GYD domain